MTGTYDPDLNLLYWGTGNPTPGAEWQARVPATISIPAASSRSIPIPANSPGPSSPRPTIPTIGMPSKFLCWWMPISTVSHEDADAGFAQRLFLRAGSDEREESVDRPLRSRELGKGIDKKGRPIPNPAKEPAPDGRLIAPDEGGFTNYRSPSFDPKTGLFIVSAHPAMASTSPSLQTAHTDGQARIMACGAKASSKPSTTRPAKFAGSMSSEPAARAPES